MQTLWSRIAQVRSCRCPQCISSTSGIARRGGATATRRAPKYLTSSTLWYSGIFAAAATFDAGVKIQRREKWDRAIAEVRKELGREERVEFGLEGDAAEAVWQDVVAEQEAEDAQVGQKDDVVMPDIGLLSGDTPLDLGPDADIFSEVEPTFREQRWPTNTGTRLVQYNLAPESIYASRERRAKGENRHWTRKKVEVIALMVEKMQVKIMQDLSRRGLSEEAASAVPKEYRKHILRPMEDFNERLRVLRTDQGTVSSLPPDLEGFERTETDFRLTSFSQNVLASDTYRAPRELNLALQRLIKDHRFEKLSTPQLLACVCHAITTSNLPPNLDTFNTLLLGLTRIEEHNAVYAVVRALHYANLRPNEVTISAILDAHTANNRPDRFAQFVERMRGKYGGLALARPGIKITEACQGRLIPRAEDPSRIIQLPYPTPKVFGSLIAGVMKFEGFETALKVCKNMGEEGWGLSMSGLNPLLRDCAERGDMQSGLGVWKHIKMLEAKARRQAGTDRPAERIPMTVFASMLRLCLSNADRNLYDEVWKHATRSHGHRVNQLSAMVKKQAGFSSSRGNESLPEDRLPNAQTLTTETYRPERGALDAGSPGTTHSPSSEHHQAGGLPRSTREVEATELSMEHLDGSLYSQDLEEYEYAERPMTMHG